MRMAPSARNDSEAEIVLQRSLTALITPKKHHKEQAHAPTTKKNRISHCVMRHYLLFFLAGKEEGVKSFLVFSKIPKRSPLKARREFNKWFKERKLLFGYYAKSHAGHLPPATLAIRRRSWEDYLTGKTAPQQYWCSYTGTSFSLTQNQYLLWARYSRLPGPFLQRSLWLNELDWETMMVKAKVIYSIISERQLSIAGAKWMWQLNSSGM